MAASVLLRGPRRRREVPCPTSSPSSWTELGALLEELTALGRQLDGDAEVSAVGGRMLAAAFSGPAGEAAGEAGAGWAAAVTAVAARTLAVAATLDAALAAYRVADTDLADRIGGASRGLVAGVR